MTAAGTHASVTALTACEACSAAKYQPKTGQVDCNSCDGSSYLKVVTDHGVTTTSCVPCLSGSECKPNEGKVLAADNYFLTTSTNGLIQPFPCKPNVAMMLLTSLLTAGQVCLSGDN